MPPIDPANRDSAQHLSGLSGLSRLSRLSRSVAGRVVLVTGAGSGMGRATAHLFADEGALVAVTDRDATTAAATAAEITGAGGTAGAWQLDVTEPDAPGRVVAEVVERFGALDVLVNNAGVSILAPVDQPDDADDPAHDAAGYDDAWATTLAVNLTGYQRMVRAALPHLLAGDAGRIVNVASTEGLGATAFITPYTASKHGVIGLTRGLAVELASRGVTVNCVCPGPIHTGMTAPIDADAKTRFARRRVPIRRYGEPEEVAHAILSLALPASSYMIGAVVVVDGGLTVQNT